MIRLIVIKVNNLFIYKPGVGDFLFIGGVFGFFNLDFNFITKTTNTFKLFLSESMITLFIYLNK